MTADQNDFGTFTDGIPEDQLHFVKATVHQTYEASNEETIPVVLVTDHAVVGLLAPKKLVVAVRKVGEVFADHAEVRAVATAEIIRGIRVLRGKATPEDEALLGEDFGSDDLVLLIVTALNPEIWEAIGEDRVVLFRVISTPKNPLRAISAVLDYSALPFEEDSAAVEAVRRPTTAGTGRAPRGRPGGRVRRAPLPRYRN